MCLLMWMFSPMLTHGKEAQLNNHVGEEGEGKATSAVLPGPSYHQGAPTPQSKGSSGSHIPL